ncbi:universal stress protein [Polaribacter reichenbachii]|uniref:Universal stress protein n=1 Tax=Polaribacter reichenbachii TaxID=996801 RepID=A0A1B8TVC8_9FLAO|nr:universal stress protein [Polaribacter reichenbachii]APZ45471.1 universal stress protein [Polaribacter reichenbachii]AUC19332.1 universal stress protein [Polaribacter reichenbachii]OBY63514.1 universal stress protein [Polaribacter reichenbachii]
MERKILIPTDFSKNAWNAIVYALKLYANETCSFYLLNSIKIKGSTMSAFSNKLQEKVTENASEELIKLKKRLDKEHFNNKHNFHIILSRQELKNSIETAIKKHKIDLVIMGTKGASGVKELFFGSNTVHIISKMKLCPILTVPEDCGYNTPKQIAFPTDFNHFYEEELSPIKEIANLYNSKIRVFHISEEESLKSCQNYNLSMLKVYLEDHPHKFDWIPNYTKKTYEINEFLKDHNISILAMINYKHSFTEDIIKEPVIKNIGFHPIVPFLVIPSQN